MLSISDINKFLQTCAFILKLLKCGYDVWKHEEKGSNTPRFKHQGTIMFFNVMKENASSSSISQSFVTQLAVHISAKTSYNLHHWVWKCDTGMCITRSQIEMLLCLIFTVFWLHKTFIFLCDFEASEQTFQLLFGRLCKFGGDSKVLYQNKFPCSPFKVVVCL
jgi:hypothetical protein